jgi:hypothetical protein
MSLDKLLHRRPPTPWEDFCSSPYLFIARRAYAACQDNARRAPSNSVRFVCISDTHNAHGSLPPLPAADVLIHAGDLTQSGSLNELTAALAWLSAQPHPHKLFIAGNHDAALADPDTQMLLQKYPNLVYLQDSSVSFNIRERSLVFYGSPHTPRHGSWPFQYPRVAPSQAPSSPIWSSIPLQTDVLITHGPPAYHLDSGASGCVALLHAVGRIRPKLHVFGHIHTARGVEYVPWTNAQKLYEGICAGTGAWWSLLPIFYELLKRICARVFQTSTNSESGGTLMVNAAVVGGMRDEMICEAIIVDI